MRDSLGGNAKTLMFVNCSPSAYNEVETKNSLEYAKRVKEIKNNPTLNLESKALQKAIADNHRNLSIIEEFKAAVANTAQSNLVEEIMRKHESTEQVKEVVSESPKSARGLKTKH